MNENIRRRIGPTPLGWLALLSSFVMIFLVFIPAVFAQDGSGIVVAVPPTEVVFNWGDFAAILLANLADPTSVAWTAFGLVMTWLVAQLPGPAKWAFNLFKVEQLLKNALAGAIHSTAGAVEGKAMNVNVGNEVFAKALQYAIDNGQDALIRWAGGTDGIAQKLIARMPVEASVTGADLVSGVTVTPAAVAPAVVAPSPAPKVGKGLTE